MAWMATYNQERDVKFKQLMGNVPNVGDLSTRKQRYKENLAKAGYTQNEISSFFKEIEPRITHATIYKGIPQGDNLENVLWGNYEQELAGKRMSTPPSPTTGLQLDNISKETFTPIVPKPAISQEPIKDTTIVVPTPETIETAPTTDIVPKMGLQELPDIRSLTEKYMKQYEQIDTGSVGTGYTPGIEAGNKALEAMSKEALQTPEETETFKKQLTIGFAELDKELAAKGLLRSGREAILKADLFTGLSVEAQNRKLEMLNTLVTVGQQSIKNKEEAATRMRSFVENAVAADLKRNFEYNITAEQINANIGLTELTLRAQGIDSRNKEAMDAWKSQQGFENQKTLLEINDRFTKENEYIRNQFEAGKIGVSEYANTLRNIYTTQATVAMNNANIAADTEQKTLDRAFAEKRLSVEEYEAKTRRLADETQDWWKIISGIVQIGAGLLTANPVLGASGVATMAQGE